MGQIVIYGLEIIRFKANDSEIAGYLFCLRNISKDWLVHNMKKTGLKGFAYDFNADYDAIAVSDISYIHKYLMKKNDIVENVWPY